MSKYINNNLDIEFNNYDDAWEDAMENMDQPDLFERFEEKVSYWELLQWAILQPKFYDEFGDVVSDCEQDYFDTYYIELEENTEDD